MVEVPVQANTPIKAGDELFRIEDTPYRAAVTEKKAALAEAKQNVKELWAALSAANRLITVRKSDRYRDGREGAPGASVYVASKHARRRADEGGGARGSGVGVYVSM